MKAKNLLAILLTFIISFGVLSLAYAEESSDVPEGYTPIYTAEDLNNIRNNLSGKYILMNDIDLSSYENWEPIGTYKTPFTGEFNGNSKIINNFKIKIDTEDKVAYAALFGAVSEGCVRNAVIKDCNVNIKAMSDNVWGVCASGLVALGNKDTIIENCIVSGIISAETNKKLCAGGIAARFSGTIRNCKNLSSVNAYVPSEYDCDYIYAGGVAGEFSGLLEKSCNTGSINAEYNYPKEFCGFIDIGGIAGNSMGGGSINDCYNIGSIIENTNQTLNLGGISGYSATVTNSHNYGNLNFSEDEDSVGGITGTTEFWFEDPWSETNEKIKNAELKNCFYSNNIMKSTGYVDEEYITNVNALSIEEFMNTENFIGFDFDNIWTMSEESGYPILKNQPEIPEKIPEESSTESTTEPSTESTTESIAESTTEPSSETVTQPKSDNCFLSYLWIVKALKQVINIIISITKNIINVFFTMI